MRFSDFALPETLCGGRYKLERRIGASVLNGIWIAYDTYRKQQRALKVLNPAASAQQRYRQRFLREARLLDKLKHPNIVNIFDVHLVDFEYFTMEYAAEGDLANYLRRHGAITTVEALMATFAILRALDHSHRLGITHRDVKPTNVLVTSTLDAVKLTDFGIAREQGGEVPLTLAGDNLGTVAYMAPEQCEDPRSADARSDVYSVGAMLYLLLSGRSPIDIADLCYDDSMLEHLPPSTRAIVRRAVDYEPANRYPSAREMANAVASAWMSCDPEEAERRPRITALDDLAAPTTMQFAQPANTDQGGSFDLFSYTQDD